MARFAVDTATEHSASIWIATLLSLCYSSLTFALRLWVKYGTLGTDDGMLGVAYILSYGQQASTMLGVVRGLGSEGTALDAPNQTRSGQVH